MMVFLDHLRKRSTVLMLIEALIAYIEASIQMGDQRKDQSRINVRA